MNSNDATHLILGVVILLAAGLKLWQLHRTEPGADRLAVRAMCLAMVAIGVSTLQEALSVIEFLDDRLGVNFAYAQRHTPFLVCFGFLVVAVLCWTRPAGPARRRRVLVSVVILLAVLAGRWALAAASPPADTAAGLVGDWAHAPRTVFASGLFIVYVGTTLTWASALAGRWVRVIREDRPATAWGLRFFVVSGIVFAVYLVHKIAFMVTVLTLRIPPPYNPEVAQYPLVVLICVTLAAAICVPLVAGLARRMAERRRQRRAHRRLRPLWAALTAHRPGVVMPLTPSWLPARLSRAWDALDPREVELRLFRRTIECWDVLTSLHGHLDVRVQHGALRAAHDAGLGDDRAPAVATAVMIRRALTRAQAGAAPLDPRYRAGPPAQDGELAANVAWWQRVAAEWDGPLTARPPAGAAATTVPTTA